MSGDPVTETAAPERQHPSLTLAVLTTAALAYALSQTMVAPARSSRWRSGSSATSSRASGSATGIGLISATFGIGGAAGLVLSGVIVDNLSYEWLFWLALVVTPPADARHASLWIPESPVKSPARIDWGGAALLSATRCALLMGVSYGQQLGLGLRPGSSALFAAAAALAVSGCASRCASPSRWST